MDSGMVPSGGDEGVEQALAADAMAVQPVQPEGGHLGSLGKVDDFGGGGPESGKSHGAVHVERVGKAAGVGDHMDEFRQDARGEAQHTALAHRFVRLAAASAVVRMFRDGPSDKKAGVDANHGGDPVISCWLEAIGGASLFALALGIAVEEIIKHIGAGGEGAEDGTDGDWRRGIGQ